LLTIEKTGEFCEFSDIDVTEISTGYFRGKDLEIGFPKGWFNFEVTEILRFFQSSIEFVDPETSRIKRLVSEVGRVTAVATEGDDTENRDALRPTSAGAHNFPINVMGGIV
jgi:hypothetical protein